MRKIQYYWLVAILCTLAQTTVAENGSRLWLRQAGNATATVLQHKHSATLDLAAAELKAQWQGIPLTLEVKKDQQLAAEGFRIFPSGQSITLTSPSEIGILYAAHHLLRLQALATANGHRLEIAETITENPAYSLRILNHWDNLDGTIERGYAGESLWNWNELPDKLSERYYAYAQANASIGINGTVINNVNASPQMLSKTYLKKVKALADLFRPYGIRVYLSVNFATPMALDSLPTADPLNKDVQRWWKKKAKEIYELIPDFGGFLVKANSEGQPGPCDFGRTHAEGANMLADALKPYGGIIMWRAFVYSPSDADRAKQAYLEFQPLDGQFRSNVILQVKNGPVDFQPREPYSPLFTSLKHTPVMAEFQITQEYLGHSNHIAYLAPMWKEFFNFVPSTSIQAIAGVTNIGNDTNWCGHHFAQSNWYAFGRLAWNPSLSSASIADEWLKQTLYENKAPTLLHQSLVEMMEESREAVVNYMMPLGLHHIFAWGHHYGPEPWCEIPGARADWLPKYYHQANTDGIGFNRSSTGSHATAQYPDSLASLYDDPHTCPENLLLWFHHVPWNFRMSNGNILWESLCRHYEQGVKQVKKFQKIWDLAEKYVDSSRFKEVQSKLKIQMRDAIWWKDACLLYFQTFSKMPIPTDIDRPIHELEDLKNVKLNINNYVCPGKDLLNKQR